MLICSLYDDPELFRLLEFTVGLKLLQLTKMREITRMSKETLNHKKRNTAVNEKIYMNPGFINLDVLNLVE